MMLSAQVDFFICVQVFFLTSWLLVGHSTSSLPLKEFRPERRWLRCWCRRAEHLISDKSIIGTVTASTSLAPLCTTAAIALVACPRFIRFVTRIFFFFEVENALQQLLPSSYDFLCKVLQGLQLFSQHRFSVPLQNQHSSSSPKKIYTKIKVAKKKCCSDVNGLFFFSNVGGRMASIHHSFARKQMKDTQKRGKPELRSSCRKSLDLHWSASARPGRGSASVSHLRYLSVSRHFNE